MKTPRTLSTQEFYSTSHGRGRADGLREHPGPDDAVEIPLYAPVAATLTPTAATVVPFKARSIAVNTAPTAYSVTHLNAF